VLWRLLLSPPLDGPDNMALDEALMARARQTGETVLRTYSWLGPTLSLGRNQRARGLYDTAALYAAGVAVIRRPTGGRALLHHREITYSVTAPARSDEAVAPMYGRINALLVNALRALGASVTIAGASGRAATPTARPCFAEPAAGELSYEGRKLAGSAQYRDDGALLQHGSILVDDDQGRIAGFTTTPGAPVPRPATLRGILGRAPSAAELHDAMADALTLVGGARTTPLELDAATRAEAVQLAVRYRDDAWTWRR
jgi:lipoate-protein ligase A